MRETTSLPVSLARWLILAAAVAGIGKGAQASGGNGTGQPPCNGLEEFHQIPQGEHVASRLFLLNQFP